MIIVPKDVYHTLLLTNSIMFSSQVDIPRNVELIVDDAWAAEGDRASDGLTSPIQMLIHTFMHIYSLYVIACVYMCIYV